MEVVVVVVVAKPEQEVQGVLVEAEQGVPMVEIMVLPALPIWVVEVEVVDKVAVAQVVRVLLL
jgi:hypothetical protein